MCPFSKLYVQCHVVMVTFCLHRGTQQLCLSIYWGRVQSGPSVGMDILQLQANMGSLTYLVVLPPLLVTLRADLRVCVCVRVPSL